MGRDPAFVSSFLQRPPTMRILAPQGTSECPAHGSKVALDVEGSLALTSALLQDSVSRSRTWTSLRYLPLALPPISINLLPCIKALCWYLDLGRLPVMKGADQWSTRSTVVRPLNPSGGITGRASVTGAEGVASEAGAGGALAASYRSHQSACSSSNVLTNKRIASNLSKFPRFFQVVSFAFSTGSPNQGTEVFIGPWFTCCKRACRISFVSSVLACSPAESVLYHSSAVKNRSGYASVQDGILIGIKM
mmetsp:Transcript_33092/g.40034  ORF Transcript_33092/g.40034 Transcript_33092/m.40034 type:complete len:249 (+) Transcript_33092:156-902(+)